MFQPLAEYLGKDEMKGLTLRQCCERLMMQIAAADNELNARMHYRYLTNMALSCEREYDAIKNLHEQQSVEK
jgi:hypothetical protein